jgi:hypothetical protein
LAINENKKYLRGLELSVALSLFFALFDLFLLLFHEKPQLFHNFDDDDDDDRRNSNIKMHHRFDHVCVFFFPMRSGISFYLFKLFSK